MSLESAKRVLRIEAEAISELIERVDARFARAVEILFACQGRVVVTGMGKSGIIARKIAATFASTGTPALFLHPAEAIHGDLGVIVRGDVLLALSYSGETEEILQLLPTVKRLGIPLLSLTGTPNSTLAQASDVALDVSIRQEACSLGLAPTASTTAALAMGDALAIALHERRGFSEDDFAALHPGGGIGKKLQRVGELMHTGEEVPMVALSTPLPEAIYEMSKKGLGMTSVMSGDRKLAGIITDGDLRRLMQRLKGKVLEMTAGECMTKNPVTISRDELAAKALNLMEQRKITALIVVDAEQRIEGVIHLHDLWTTEMF